VLPSTEAVRLEVAQGGSHITYLQVALSIMSRIETELDPARYGDEVRFVRECLTAGRRKTAISVQLMDESQASNEVRMGLTDTYNGSGAQRHTKRKGYELRGALWAVRTSVAGTLDPLAEGESRQGLPWMGPAIPMWPVSDLGAAVATKIQTFFEDQFNTWGFDIFEFDKITGSRSLLFCGWEAFLRSGCFSEFPIDWQKVTVFLAKVESLYKTEKQTPYHNRIHAADVTQTVHALCYDLGLSAFYDPMDWFVTTLGAIIHDLGHHGKSNAYHVAMQDELALTYNDKSVLENFHLSLAFKMLSGNADTNLLSGMSRDQVAVVRKEVIDMVLGTDMAQHFSRVGDLSRLISTIGKDAEVWQSDDAHMMVLRAMVLHCADISNPTKPFKLATQWSFRVLQEFFLQGDAEMAAGVPISPLCDRVNTDIPGSQIGFIKFITLPAFDLLGILAPKVKDICVVEAIGNHKVWEHRSKNRDFYEETRDPNFGQVQEEDFYPDREAGLSGVSTRVVDTFIQAELGDDENIGTDTESRLPMNSFWAQLWGCSCR